MPEELIFLLPLAVMVFGSFYVMRNQNGAHSKKQNETQNKNNEKRKTK